MPFRPRVHAPLSSGLLLAVTLAIGCAPTPGGGGGPNLPDATARPTTSPSGGATPGPSPSATASPGQATEVSFRTQVAPLLQNRCSTCHSGAGSGGVSLFDGSGNPRHESIRSRMEAILAAVKSGAMPRGGPRLSSSEVGLLESWNDAGAPDN